MDRKSAALGRELRERAEAIYETRKFVGNCPRWYRRRDARHTAVKEFTGRRESDRTGRRAQFVVDNGIPALLKAMDAGTVKISAAALIAELSESEQHEVMADPALRRTVLRYVRDELPEDRPAKVAVTVDRAMIDALIKHGMLDADESTSRSAIAEAIAHTIRTCL